MSYSKEQIDALVIASVRKLLLEYIYSAILLRFVDNKNLAFRAQLVKIAADINQVSVRHLDKREIQSSLARLKQLQVRLAQNFTVDVVEELADSASRAKRHIQAQVTRLIELYGSLKSDEAIRTINSIPSELTQPSVSTPPLPLSPPKQKQKTFLPSPSLVIPARTPLSNPADFLKSCLIRAATKYLALHPINCLFGIVFSFFHGSDGVDRAEGVKRIAQGKNVTEKEIFQLFYDLLIPTNKEFWINQYQEQTGLKEESFLTCLLQEIFLTTEPDKPEHQNYIKSLLNLDSKAPLPSIKSKSDREQVRALLLSANKVKQAADVSYDDLRTKFKIAEGLSDADNDAIPSYK